jgi:hypothetical protein
MMPTCIQTATSLPAGMVAPAYESPMRFFRFESDLTGDMNSTSPISQLMNRFKSSARISPRPSVARPVFDKGVTTVLMPELAFIKQLIQESMLAMDDHPPLTVNIQTAPQTDAAQWVPGRKKKPAGGTHITVFHRTLK